MKHYPTQIFLTVTDPNTGRETMRWYAVNNEQHEKFVRGQVKNARTAIKAARERMAAAVGTDDQKLVVENLHAQFIEFHAKGAVNANRALQAKAPDSGALPKPLAGTDGQEVEPGTLRANVGADEGANPAEQRAEGRNEFTERPEVRSLDVAFEESMQGTVKQSQLEESKRSLHSGIERQAESDEANGDAALGRPGSDFEDLPASTGIGICDGAPVSR